MYVRPRPRFRPRNAGGVPFSPALLFTSGVAGAWYDPSDINNYMAGLGPELVTNGDFSSSSSWTLAAGSGGSATISGGALTLSGGTSSFPNATQSTILTSGKYYSVTVVMSSAVTSGSLALRMGGGTATYQLFTSAGTYTLTLLADGTDLRFIRNSGFSDTAVIDSISVKEVTGIANATLFQDSAGTTPVTAVEQPVGLMLDKSQGLAITATAIDGNLNTATWTKGTGWSAPSARSLVCDGSQTGSSDTSASYTKPTGALVRWSFTISAISGTLTIYPTGGTPSTFTTTGAKTVCSDAASNFNIFRMGAGQTCTITDIRIEIIAGNHASQATAASRPVLRARYNLLTYSEQLDNAAWAVTNASRSVGVTDPNGGTTAATITATAANGYIRYAFSAGALSATNSIFIRRRTGTGIIYLNTPDNATASPVSVTSSWQRFQVSSTGTIISLIVLIQTSGDAIDIAFPQMNWGSSASAYQRIAAATDYATAGFLPYLALDGTDDGLATANIDFTSTNKVSIFSGFTKLADSATGTLVELSSSYSANTGAFAVQIPQGASLPDMVFSSNGTTFRSAVSAIGAAPVTRVTTNLADIAAPSILSRVDGIAGTPVTTSQGTGNYGTYPLYIGRRAGTSLPLNGRIYQLVICGKTASASELASTEAYVATKTGVTL